MRDMAERTRRSCVLPLLVVFLVVGPAAVEAQLLPSSPAVPHPDSSGFVVARQVAAVMAAGLMMDGPFREMLAAESAADHHRLSRLGNLLGHGEKIGILLAVAYGGSKLSGLDGISGPTGKTLAALLVAGTANGLIKFTVGRARPGVASKEVDSFSPFSVEDRMQSFPSGHAVTAFALAGAISEQTDRGWVTGASFGAAALVGWSRIHEDRHWTSDVFAGAIVGTVASKFTVRRLIARSAKSGAAPASAGSSDPFGGAVLYPIPSGLAVMIPIR